MWRSVTQCSYPLLHAADRGEESMAELKRAVSIFSAIDADETTRQPEVWKLVSWVRHEAPPCPLRCRAWPWGTRT